MKNFVRILGDIHQRYDIYYNLIKDAPYSIQIGDLGLSYKDLVGKFDTDKHKFLGGNHDLYDRNNKLNYWNVPSSLGNYGVYQIEDLKIFFVRGGWSIDHEWRQRQQNNGGYVSWWPEEELSVKELGEAIELYKQEKPSVMLTHECPMSIVQYVTDPKFCLNFGYPAGTIKTRTNLALQSMFDYHKPDKWFFGHFHQRWQDNIDGTDFICLDMCRSADQTSNYYDLEI